MCTKRYIYILYLFLISKYLTTGVADVMVRKLEEIKGSSPRSSSPSRRMRDMAFWAFFVYSLIVDVRQLFFFFLLKGFLICWLDRIVLFVLVCCYLLVCNLQHGSTKFACLFGQTHCILRKRADFISINKCDVCYHKSPELCDDTFLKIYSNKKWFYNVSCIGTLVFFIRIIKKKII